MTVQEACAQAFENGRKVGEALGYERGRREAVKHGRWIETDEGTIFPECCENPFEDGYLAIANYNGDWCPNCGARMDGGEDG